MSGHSVYLRQESFELIDVDLFFCSFFLFRTIDDNLLFPHQYG